MEMAAQYCAIQFFAVEFGVPMFNANIPTNHALSKSKFFGLRFCCRQCGCNFDHYGIIGPKVIAFGEIMQKNGDYAVQDISRITIWY